jgi:hypothetical protein
MRVAHFGGYRLAVEALAKYQKRLGAHVITFPFDAPFSLQAHAPPAREPPLSLQELLDLKFDVVHFHLVTGFELIRELQGTKATPEAILSEFRAHGTKIFYSTYDCDLMHREALLPAADKVRTPCAGCIAGKDPYARSRWCEDDPARQIRLQEIAKFVDHVFIGSFDTHPLASQHPSWSWLNLPVDLESIPKPPVVDPKTNSVKIVHIADRPAKRGSHLITQAMELLLAKKLPVEFEIIVPELHDLYSLLSSLRAVHVIIEQITSRSYGYLGAVGMALGKTVLSGISPEAKQAWDQLSFCPVLDCTADNLVSRIESIVREPRCTRDFGKRGREYAEKFHHPELIAKLTLDKYGEFL